MEAAPAASSSEDGTLFADHRIVEASVDVHPAPPAAATNGDPHIVRPSFKLNGLETTGQQTTRHQLPLQESSSMDTATIGSSKSLVTTDQGEYGRRTLLDAGLLFT